MPPLDVVRRDALVQTSRLAVSSVAKGDALQELVEFVLQSVPGFFYFRPKQLNIAASEEIDLAFCNDPVVTHLTFLGSVPLVEIKNWTGTVGSGDIIKFAGKLRHRGCECGILVAANGVSGDVTGQTAGQNELAVAQLEGQRVLVVTLDEIAILLSSEEVVRLLQRKVTELVARQVQSTETTATMP